MHATIRRYERVDTGRLWPSCVWPGSTHWRVPRHAWKDEGGATLTCDGR
jgi:hypothetical protein